MDCIIKTEGLQKVYGKASKAAIQDVNLSISQGEIFGLLGPNGAGKTTLVLMLTTLTKPTQGNGYVCNYDIVTQANDVRASLGYCPQKTSVDDELTAWENMMLYAQLSGLSKKESEMRVKQLLEEASLVKQQHDLVRKFSGGMRRRLEVMGALISKPKIIFLDEPTLGLDPDFRRELWQRIRQARDDGSTIFITTHYMEEADELCDRIAIIDSGQIKVIGDPKELKSQLGEVIHIRLMDTSQTDLVMEHLKSLDQKAKVINNSDELYVYTFDGENLSASLMLSLKAKDIKVKSISYSCASLEDVFYNYTGQRIFEEI